MMGEDLIQVCVELDGGTLSIGGYAPEDSAAPYRIAPDRIRVVTAQGKPLPSAEGAAFQGVGAVRRIEHRARQGLSEERCQSDQIVTIGAVAMEQNNGFRRGCAGGG